jgi:hypothetical protein
LSTVHIRDFSYPRARAVLPIEISTCHWSLAPSTLRYVCPTIVDLTKKTIYAWVPRPGQSGLRLSNVPESGLRVLSFRSSGQRIATFLRTTSSSAAFVHVSSGSPSLLQLTRPSSWTGKIITSKVVLRWSLYVWWLFGAMALLVISYMLNEGMYKCTG